MLFGSTVQVTPEMLGMLAGVVLSLLASYVPKFSPWFKELQPDSKRLVMLGVLFTVTLALFGFGCAGVVQLGEGMTCTVGGGMNALFTFILAVIANQSTYAITPRGKKA